ncbi:MAG: peptide MFS transporter [Hyphomonadaceae bacterium]|nr:peptide MFS transporter [Hyphomonadaceae bacterium]
MTEAVADSAGAKPRDTSFFGHPKGLAILFFTEMWERFSYYGMRGLLVLYLTQHFLFSDEKSSIMYGAYTALVYVMTIIGGTLADRYLGQRKAVTFGAILLCIGHFGMAFEGTGSKEYVVTNGAEIVMEHEGRGDNRQLFMEYDGVERRITFDAESGDMLVLETADREREPTAGVYATIAKADYTTRVEQQTLYTNILFLSLAFIIAGVGYLKANISTIVGALYEFDDPRRDSGFSLFYMGINLGSLISSLTCGIIGIVWGWKYGFGLAGIGMLAGLMVFVWGQKFLDGKAEPPNPELLKKSFLGPITVEMACYLAGAVVIAVAMLLVMNAEIIPEWFVGSLGIAVFVGLVVYAFIQLNGTERNRMFAAIYFVLAQIPFWALFEQAGSSLTLFTDRLVDKTMFGINVPTPVFQFLNAGYIVIFAPIFAWMWIALSKRNMEPSTPVKFAIGVFLAGLGFLSLVGGMGASGSTGLTAVYFIFLIYWVHTMGELMVSPVGLSAVTKMAPARVVGMTMGAWFLYSGLSNYLAGVIARTTGAETIGGQITNVAEAKATYVSVYTNVAYVAMGIGVFMLLISPIIKSWMRTDVGAVDSLDDELRASGEKPA